MTDSDYGDAFDALQCFAGVWHDKYAHANGGENRKPPSLTMRAGDDAAVLTEPQLRAVLAEYARMRNRLALPYQLATLAEDRLMRNLGMSIAVADRRGCSEEYLDGAANTFVQVLMELNGLELNTARRVTLDSILAAQDRLGVPRRPSWQSASDNVELWEMEVGLRLEGGGGDSS